MKKILLVGYNSYLANNIEFESDYIVNKIQRPFENDYSRYNDYDYVVNFCIQPEHFSSYLSEDEMIDLNIAKSITNKNTKLVFLSSRKVYGSNVELKYYSENDILHPFDFYSHNKVNIENKLKIIMPNQLLILRTSNIVGLPPKKNSPNFISWFDSELKKRKKVTVTIDKNAKKDFITKKYFQYVLKNLIENDATGIYNVGASFGITIKELMENLVSKERLFYEQKEDKGEQFILNCDKLHTVAKELTKEELLKECLNIKVYMENNLV